MNPPKCDDLGYIHFLIAAQKVFTRTEAARCAPEGARWPTRPSPACRRRCGGQPRLSGLLALEDKPCARQMERVTFHRSGKQRRVVQGIARVYDKPAGGPSENPHFREMLQTADRCAGLALSDPAGEPGRAGRPTHRGGGGSAGGAGGTPEGLGVRRAGTRNAGRPMACRWRKGSGQNWKGRAGGSGRSSGAVG